MKVGRSHLTYCTNIHPGETWNEIRANLGRHLPEVKQRVSPSAPFGVGLRLSAVAAEALRDPAVNDEFVRFLRDEDLYVFTLNGFPYGPFHGTRVKEGVYQPDWRQDARLEYTNLLADLLAVWLPGDGMTGSISTVPGAFKAEIRSSSDIDSIVDRLLRHAAYLVDVERRTGREIVLALEPEPCCFLETIDETVAFFTDRLHSIEAAGRLASLTGLDAPAAARALRSHLGVCVDLCHAAVEFEDPERCFDALDGAGIRVGKVQVTAGLRIDEVTTDAAEALGKLGDSTYLHQVVERRTDRLHRFEDIAPAIDSRDWRAGGSEWRIHFHVPVFLESLEGFQSTQAFVRDALRQCRERATTPHLEVETYTWSVLPARYRQRPIGDAIAGELEWTRSEFE